MELTHEQRALADAAFANKLNVIWHAYVDITGDLIAGALLGQILYWFGADRNGRPRARIQKDGYLWIAKARGDWWHEIRITPKQYDRAAKILKEKNLIEIKTMKFAGNPTTHIRIKAAEINHAIDKWKYEQVAAQVVEIAPAAAVGGGSGVGASGYYPSGNNHVPQTGNQYSPFGEFQGIPNGDNEIDQRDSSLTEITAETTNESTAESTHTVSARDFALFEDIWNQYPKKENKAKAQRAYMDSLAKGANALAIYVEAALYRQYCELQMQHSGLEWRYIPNGGSWFENERWQDEVPTMSSKLDYDTGALYAKTVSRLRNLAASAKDAQEADRMAILDAINGLIGDLPY